MIVGQDLVEWQIRVANGEPLPLAQSEVPFSGSFYLRSAISNRMYVTQSMLQSMLWLTFLAKELDTISSVLTTIGIEKNSQCRVFLQISCCGFTWQWHLNLLNKYALLCWYNSTKEYQLSTMNKILFAARFRRNLTL